MFQKCKLIYLLLLIITIDVSGRSYKLVVAKKNIQMEASVLWVIIEISGASSGWLQSLQGFIAPLKVC